MSLSDKRGDQPEAAASEEAAQESPAPAETPADPEELRRLLAAKTQEAQDNYDRLLRLAADLENLKKRQEKERGELVQFAHENLLKELLPVLDNLERALEHGRQSEAPAPWLEGVELVQQEFLKVLARFGVTPLECVGEQFDPAFHHAVMEEEAPELPDQIITKELQKGYLMKTRLLRPAMVMVARNPQKSVKVDLKV